VLETEEVLLALVETEEVVETEEQQNKKECCQNLV